MSLSRVDLGGTTSVLREDRPTRPTGHRKRSGRRAAAAGQQRARLGPGTGPAGTPATLVAISRNAHQNKTVPAQHWASPGERKGREVKTKLYRPVPQSATCVKRLRGCPQFEKKKLFKSSLSRTDVQPCAQGVHYYVKKKKYGVNRGPSEDVPQFSGLPRSAWECVGGRGEFDEANFIVLKGHRALRVRSLTGTNLVTNTVRGCALGLSP